MRCSSRLGALAALLIPFAAEAQVGRAARASTLGIGAELSLRAGSRLGLRLGGHYFQISRDVTIEGNRYTATPHFENGVALVDVFPFGGTFHVTGGVILNYNEGRLAAHLPVTIDGRTYSETEVSSMTGGVTFDRTAPYLGIGLAGQGRVELLLDLGVGFTGTPIVGLGAETSLQGAEQLELEARLARERDEVQADISKHAWLRYHPVLSIGLKLGF